ncbi:hypothetical protein IWZ03DRAFT_71570 [Phyllosticta citriasiana]|uniref:Uncharacterized protein n=1 Tax=Phyllosticta citriasiana TaxID=595635 RepID=A0ABR1KAE8_9PEZI
MAFHSYWSCSDTVPFAQRHGNDDIDDSTPESTLEEDDHTSATDTSSEASTNTDSEVHNDEEEEPSEFHEVGLGFIRPGIPQYYGRREAAKNLRGRNGQCRGIKPQSVFRELPTVHSIIAGRMPNCCVQHACKMFNNRRFIQNMANYAKEFLKCFHGQLNFWDICCEETIFDTNRALFKSDASTDVSGSHNGCLFIAPRRGDGPRAGVIRRRCSIDRLKEHSNAIHFFFRTHTRSIQNLIRQVIRSLSGHGLF